MSYKGEVKKVKYIYSSIRGKKFDVAVVDPPWKQDVGGHYDTQSLADISELTLPLKNEAQVFVWTTQPFLLPAYVMLKIWDLRYRCTFVWNKTRGYQKPYLPRFNCEFALYATRGEPKFINIPEKVTGEIFDTCNEWKEKEPDKKVKGVDGVWNRWGVNEHSEKPEEFYQLLRDHTKGQRIDMFNRRPIGGFKTWGNEAEMLHTKTRVRVESIHFFQLMNIYEGRDDINEILEFIQTGRKNNLMGAVCNTSSLEPAFNYGVEYLVRRMEQGDDGTWLYTMVDNSYKESIHKSDFFDLQPKRTQA